MLDRIRWSDSNIEGEIKMSDDAKEWVDIAAQRCGGCKEEIPGGTLRKLSLVLKGSKISFTLMNVSRLYACDSCLDDLKGATIEVEVGVKK